jgi:catechol 2,3-dioxygenase-like lactoylglutathione lyase family enzyme
VASRLRGTPAGGTMLRPTFAYAKLPARDIERARRFYAGALGVHPFAERDGHLYYDIGGCRFMVFTSTGSASGAHDQLGFVTADLAGHVAQMRGSGVVFEDFAGTSDGIADFGPVRAAWFRDSEGNLINLIEGNSPLWSS